MPNRKIDMVKIKEVVRLSNEQKLSNRAISRSLEISKTTVSKISKALASYDLEEIKFFSEEQLYRICYSDKNKGSDNIEEQNLKELTDSFPEMIKDIKKVGVTTKILWKEYRSVHVEGYSYSRFCHHFNKWRSALKVVMHLEHKAGEAMFCDYAGDKFPIYNRNTDKEEKRVSTFLSILPASHITFAVCTETEKTKDWISGCRQSLEYFGGVPLGIVPDNAKAVITKADKYDPQVNPQFKSFSEHYGTCISPARVRKPQDKALVEGAVKLIYQRIYAPLRKIKFYSIGELNIEVRKLLDKHNDTYMMGYKSTRRKMFDETEKTTLSKLPNEPYYFREVELRRTVGINYHVFLKEDNHYYSVPFRFIKEKCNIYYDDSVVEVWLKGNRIATHARERGNSKYTTTAIHMPKPHQEYESWSTDRFNSWAKSIGKSTASVVQEIFSKQKFPQLAFRVVLGLLNLSNKYGKERLENACGRSVSFDNYSFWSIKDILEKGIDLKIHNEEQLVFNYDIPPNSNTRGSDFYTNNKQEKICL